MEIERTAYHMLRQEYRVIHQGPVRRLDTVTREHCERVSQHATELARLWGLTGSFLQEIKIAGLIHDVGKVHADQDVLWYPGKLEECQKQELRLHPIDSERIAVFHGIPPRIRRFVREHHEFFDGTGYPDNKKGDEVSVGASIIKVADEWDRMRNVTPWRPYVLSPKEALDELYLHVNKRYPRHVVELAEQWLHYQK